jgi:acyl carrier protein
MPDPDVLEVVKMHLADLCGLDRSAIRAEGELIGYGLDSVRALDFLIAMEEEYGVELSEHDPALARVRTVRELVDFIQQRRGRR